MMPQKRILVDDSQPPVARPRQTLVERAPKPAVRTKLVGQEPYRYHGDESTPVRFEHLPWIRNQLDELSQELSDAPFRAYKLMSETHSDQCFLASEEEGHYTRPRKVQVCYKRATQPTSSDAFTVEEYAGPFPKLHYLPHKKYDVDVHICFVNDNCGGEIEVEGKMVPIMFSDMFAKMSRHPELVEWVYHPCLADYTYAPDEWILVGCSSKTFYTLEGSLIVARREFLTASVIRKAIGKAVR
ncbi:MAG: hypothetical protein NTX72_00900 [Candidatus Uhrbacteria bacterium]|nr:hypothetical protein [Candidatus Uhrbacteria bacterium]